MRRNVILLVSLGILILQLNNCLAITQGAPANINYFYGGGKTSFSSNGYEASDLEGEACVKSFLALFASGDASIERAAGNGSIKNIRSVSHKFYPNWFGIHTVCTIVRGTR